MRVFRAHVYAIGILLVAGLGILSRLATSSSSGSALSTSSSTGTDVTLRVSRLPPPPGKEASTPQYLVTAQVTRPGLSEPLSSPRVQTPQGVQASVTSGTADGMKVTLRVTVSEPEELQYEVEVTEPGKPVERHRASIVLPQRE
jgi:hypothetical protein